MSSRDRHPYDDTCRCEACIVQAVNRMRACGLVEKVGKKYRLTAQGRAFVAVIKAEQANNPKE